MQREVTEEKTVECREDVAKKVSAAENFTGAENFRAAALYSSLLGINLLVFFKCPECFS